MSTTTYDKSFDKAFIAGEQFFRRLESLVAAHHTEGKTGISYKIALNDSSTIDHLSLDELLDVPNSKHRRINQVDVTTSYVGDLRFSMTLRDRSVLAPVTYQVSGPDRDAAFLASETEKLLKETFQTYSYMAAKSDNHKALWAAIFYLAGVAVAYIGGQSGNISLALLAVVLMFGSFIVYPLIRMWLFPRGIFAIGDGTELVLLMKARRRQFASILLIGIVLSVVVGVFTNFLYDTYLKR